MRRDWAFHEDKLVARARSLNIDYEDEVRYEKIKTIQNRTRRDLDWLWVTFIVAGLTSLAWLVLPILGVSNNNSVVRLAAQGMVVVAYVLAIAAFRKFEWYSFIDAEDRVLATVFVEKRTKKSMLEAIDLVKSKNPDVRETYGTDGLPSVAPKFQITELDVPDFFSRSTVRFYEDRLVDAEKSWAEELVTVVHYDELREGTKIAKMGNENWGNLLGIWFMLVVVGIATANVFFSRQICGNLVFARACIAALLLLVPLFLLRYIKREMLVFSNKLGNPVFWTPIRASNREILDRIVAFVEGRKAAS